MARLSDIQVNATWPKRPQAEHAILQRTTLRARSKGRARLGQVASGRRPKGQVPVEGGDARDAASGFSPPIRSVQWYDWPTTDSTIDGDGRR